MELVWGVFSSLNPADAGVNQVDKLPHQQLLVLVDYPLDSVINKIVKCMYQLGATHTDILYASTKCEGRRCWSSSQLVAVHTTWPSDRIKIIPEENMRNSFPVLS